MLLSFSLRTRYFLRGFVRPSVPLEKTRNYDTAVLIVCVQTAFEVPLNNVSHCVTAKNEVTLEFHQNDDAAVSLYEMRFHVPNDAAAAAADKEGEDKEEKDDAVEVNNDEFAFLMVRAHVNAKVWYFKMFYNFVSVLRSV